MGFDPAAYLKAKSPGFDPAAYLKSKRPPQVAPEPSNTRPSVKSDVELGIESPLAEPPRGLLERLAPAPDRTNYDPNLPYSRRQAEDPIQNDPLAAAIVQGIPAAGAGALVASATGVPILGMAAQGAIQDPEHPIRGAALNMIPGIPGAVRQADNAIGRASLARVGTDKSFVPAGKALGAATGAYAGHHAAGFVGGGVGMHIGGKLGAKAGELADRAVGSLADRYLSRTAQFPDAAATYTPPAFPSAPEAPRGPVVDAEVVHAPEASPAPRLLGPRESPPPPPRKPLAPLVPQGPSIMERALRRFDEISGEPLTNGGKPPPPATNTATHGGATNAGGKGVTAAQVREAPAPDLAHADTQVAPSSLRDDVVKAAKQFREAPPETPPEVPPADTVEGKLAASIKILDNLRKAKANGTLTPEMEQEAVNAGIPQANVARVLGGRSTASADNPIAKARKAQVRNDAKNARILSGRNE